MPLTLRSATDADREAVFALGVAEEASWFGAPEVDAAEVGEWIDEEGGLASGVVAVDDNGTIRGFAAPGRVGSVFLADPTLTSAVADRLLPWLRDSRADPEVLTFAGDSERLAALERHGFTHTHSAFTLARGEEAGPLPRAEFDAYLVRRHTPGDDDEAIHRLVYRDAAWGAVPGHVERDLEQWRAMVRSAPYQFVASDGDRPVGFVAARLTVSGRGWVDQLAVAESERGNGLGRALLVHAFRALQDNERTHTFALGVQAANEAALGLYRSIGLEVEREFRVFR